MSAVKPGGGTSEKKPDFSYLLGQSADGDNRRHTDVRVNKFAAAGGGSMLKKVSGGLSGDDMAKKLSQVLLKSL